MTAVSRKLLVAVLLIGWSQAASAQTADEVIEKHLAAIGGRAALTKLESRLMVGTITLSTPGGDVTGPIETLNQYPNKQRTLIKLDLSALGAGERTTDFLDQREVDGVKVPFLLKSSSAVQSFTITITKVEHNGKVDDALFRKPADR